MYRFRSIDADLRAEIRYCGSRLKWCTKKKKMFSTMSIFFSLLTRLRCSRADSFDRIYALERHRDKCTLSRNVFKERKANGNSRKAAGWQSEREKRNEIVSRLIHMYVYYI